MPSVRTSYLLASAGFTMSSVASALGAAPEWPNDLTWTIVGALAALALLLYALHPTAPTLSMATSTVVVAGGARIIGWIYSAPTVASTLSASGVWVVVCSLMFLVHHKARQLRE